MSEKVSNNFDPEQKIPIFTGNEATYGTYAESGPTQFDNFRNYFWVTNCLKI